MVQAHPFLCCVGIIFFASLLPAAEAPLLKLSSVPFTQVQIEDAFWAPRQEINRTVSIPINLEMLDKSGNLINFDLAAGGKRKGYNGPVYMDSDLYKALEAASYSLATHPDAALDKKIDAIIRRIAAAQQKDGYLNTYYTVNEPDKRWTNLRDNHELYCAGHLFEAAVAHYQATGKRTLLRTATRFADYICSVFGPGPGQRMGYPGHPEIELALIKLWRVTGHQRYFDLARFFIENRGIHFFAREHQTPEAEYDGSYWQDDVPLSEHRPIKGHALR
ncbi:glycoside hydrolase family 127 protein, partial [bacterium]|nr:glycoside hydrolase family 127 protein [bacterium]